VDNYLDQLYTSTLPVSLWLIALLWFVVFICNQLTLRRMLSLLGMQTHIAYEIAEDVYGLASSKTMTYQCVSASAVFAYAWFVDYDVVTTFFAGGWVLVSVVSFASNVRALFWMKLLTRDGMAVGTLTVSSTACWQDRALWCFGSALMCLLVGLLVAHLTFFGAVFIFGASGIGYWRRAFSSIKTRG
jgi:hypothetical protein